MALFLVDARVTVHVAVGGEAHVADLAAERALTYVHHDISGSTKQFTATRDVMYASKRSTRASGDILSE